MRHLVAVSIALVACAANGRAQDFDSIIGAPALAVVRAALPANSRIVPHDPEVKRADIVRCSTRRPDSCIIVGGDTYIELLNTSVSGDDGTATIGLWLQRQNARQPVGQRTYHFQLRRINGVWTVVGKPQMRTS